MRSFVRRGICVLEQSASVRIVSRELRKKFGKTKCIEYKMWRNGIFKFKTILKRLRLIASRGVTTISQIDNNNNSREAPSVASY